MRRRASGAVLLLATASSSFRRLAWSQPPATFARPNVTAPSVYGSGLVRRLAVGSGAKMPSITVLTTEDAADKAAKVADASKAELADAAVTTEEVKSYYWWEGKVNFDPEWRVAVTTTAAFCDAKEAIGKVHSYDLPMIIYDLDQAAEDHPHWKALIQLSGEEAIKLAEKLVERRVVACAQASASGMLAVKTVARCKPMVEESASTSVVWSPIGGNEGYLKWLEDECVAGKS